LIRRGLAAVFGLVAAAVLVSAYRSAAATLLLGDLFSFCG
jgi:hypothetical protein